MEENGGRRPGRHRLRRGGHGRERARGYHGGAMGRRRWCSRQPPCLSTSGLAEERVPCHGGCFRLDRENREGTCRQDVGRNPRQCLRPCPLPDMLIFLDVETRTQLVIDSSCVPVSAL